MTIFEALKFAVEAGTPAAFIAKKIGKDPSTVQKWLRGKSNVSEETQEDIKQQLKKIKAIWDKINI